MKVKNFFKCRNLLTVFNRNDILCTKLLVIFRLHGMSNNGCAASIGNAKVLTCKGSREVLTLII